MANQTVATKPKETKGKLGQREPENQATENANGYFAADISPSRHTFGSFRAAQGDWHALFQDRWASSNN